MYISFKDPLPLDNHSNLPHGTEVRFDCTKAGRSWKIVCHNGRWVGLSLGKYKVIYIKVPCKYHRLIISVLSETN